MFLVSVSLCIYCSYIHLALLLRMNIFLKPLISTSTGLGTVSVCFQTLSIRPGNQINFSVILKLHSNYIIMVTRR